MTQANNVAIESSQINSSGVLQPAGGGTGVTTSTGSGSVVLDTRPTMSITGAGLTLQDATDNTKSANFVLSGLTTGTNYQYTLPAVTGTLASINLNQTWTASPTFGSGMTATGLVSIGSSASALNMGSSQTTSIITVGGASGTGNIIVGQSTVSQTTNIQAGITASGSTKTINIGTNGASGSTTAINIGGTAGTSTITLNGTVNGTISTATTANATNTANNFQMNSLGVGTAGSTTAGEIRATNNITAYYSSDRQFKENVQDIQNATEKVAAIGGKTFDWTDAYLEAHGGEDGYFYQKSDFGVIAQDVQAVFPQAVRTRKDGTLAIDYAKLVAVSFAAISELTKRIEMLENK
jgi:hypothetical protein